MAHGTFLWADLSTFRPPVTRTFYERLFGWKFSDYTATLDGLPVAGLYEMPEKFQQIRMPSFWMSYISVDDVAAAVAKATDLGGRVELGPEPFEGGGQYALIRDPLGAGFTVYQGDALDGAATGLNARMGHTLFVSDASAVTGFYTSLFGWAFQSVGSGVYEVLSNDRRIAHIHEVPDPSVRGKEQYWGILFGHPNLTAARNDLERSGGSVVADVQLPEGPAVLTRDPDGAAFFLVAGSAASPMPSRWAVWSVLGLVLLAGLAALVASGNWQ